MTTTGTERLTKSKPLAMSLLSMTNEPLTTDQPVAQTPNRPATQTTQLAPEVTHE